MKNFFKTLASGFTAGIAVALVLCMTSCSENSISSNQNSSGNSLPDTAIGKKFIGLLSAGSDKSYNAATNVFEVLAEEKGWTVIRCVSDYETEKEAYYIDDFISKKVDAVVMSSINVETGAKATEKCIDAGIPIFFFITVPDTTVGTRPTSAVSADWYMTAYLNGEYIAQNYPNARCVIVEGAYNQGLAEQMRQGFKDGLKSCSDSKAELVLNYSGSWMKPNAMAAMEQMLLSGVSFDCIFTGNEEMLSGVVDVLESKGVLADYHLFSENGREDIGIDYLNSGILEATTGAAASAEGDLAFQLVDAYFQGKPIPSHIYNPVLLLTKENVEMAIPWDTDTYIAKKRQGVFKIEYADMQTITEERTWSTEGNNYQSVNFYK